MTISLFKRKNAVAKMLSVLRAFGSDAHLYLPGIGVISGVQAGNYLDSIGTTNASVDGNVGLVKDPLGSLNATQSTTGYQPKLRRGIVNLLTWSNDLTNAAWSKNGSSLVGGQADSSGGTSAVKIVENTANSQHYALQSITSNASSVTLACIVKASGRSKVRLRSESPSTSSLTATFDLTDGTVFSGSGSAVSLGDGFYLCAAPSGGVGTGVSGYHLIQPVNEAGLETYLGDGTSGVILHRSGLFQGALTAQKILAAGGIPLTTTAPASSSAGAYKWEFDGTDDLLNITIPAGYESSTIINIPATGQVVSNAQNIVGTYPINSTTYGRVVLKTQPSAADLATIKLGLKVITGIA